MPKTDKPNILVIWGDDIGITNLSCYSSGLMGYRTPNIDRLANEGMRFTDAYGEQSCTAGRSSFITGQSVFRTGLSKVGIPAAPVGLRLHDADGTPKALMRAVEIHDLNDPGNGYFLAATAVESEAVKIEVVRDNAISMFGVSAANEEMVAGPDPMINAGDYAVLRPLRPDLVAEAPSGVDGVAA